MKNNDIKFIDLLILLSRSKRHHVVSICFSAMVFSFASMPNLVYEYKNINGNSLFVLAQNDTNLTNDTIADTAKPSTMTSLGKPNYAHRELMSNESSSTLQANTSNKTLDDKNYNNLTLASDRLKPDRDCLFNPDLPKCAATDGNCPEGFNMNEDEQCIPEGGCPVGFHWVEDDETGTCYPNSKGCPEDMIFTRDKSGCVYKE